MRTLRSSVAIVFAMTALSLCGCQTARVPQTLVSQLKTEGDDAQMEFWHRLNDEPVASNDDAFHAVLLYFDGSDSHPDYAARVAAMKQRRMLPGGFNAPPDQAIERGTLAVALVRALQLRGGMMLHVLADNPRYAVRELYYEDIYPLSSPQQTFSGSELVGIIGRVEDYQRGDPANKPAAQMPSEASVNDLRTETKR
jgi:hypothetical protein